MDFFSIILKIREIITTKQYRPAVKEKRYVSFLAKMTTTPKATLKAKITTALRKLMRFLFLINETMPDKPIETKTQMRNIGAFSMSPFETETIVKTEKVKTRVVQIQPITSMMTLTASSDKKDFLVLAISSPYFFVSINSSSKGVSGAITNSASKRYK